VKLNLKFDLAHFEAALSGLTEATEAEAGNRRFDLDIALDSPVEKSGLVENITFTDLNIGLSVDFKARARLTEKFALNSEVGTAKESSYGRQHNSYKHAVQSMLSARNFRAETFYKNSFKSKYTTRTNYSDDHIRVTKKLAMKYSEDFSLHFRSLEQFQSQSEQLAQTDRDGLLTAIIYAEPGDLLLKEDFLFFDINGNNNENIELVRYEISDPLGRLIK